MSNTQTTQAVRDALMQVMAHQDIVHAEIQTLLQRLDAPEESDARHIIRIVELPKDYIAVGLFVLHYFKNIKNC